MATFYKKTALACVVAAASAVACALPISVERSQTIATATPFMEKTVPVGILRAKPKPVR